MRTTKAILGATLAALLAAGAARAADTAAPVITHTPVTHAKPGPLKISAKVEDESRIFPQVFFRHATTGPFEPPLDLKKAKSSKDETRDSKSHYEVLIPAKAGALDYYIECYDEYGNGPARAGTPEAPNHVDVSDDAAPAAKPMAAAAPAPAADKVVAAAPVAAPAPKSEAAEPAAPETRREAPPEALQLQLKPTPSSANDALIHSLMLPGWGQFRSDRPIRGTAFAVAATVGVVASVLLIARADSANSTFENSPLSTRQEAYNQAVSYEHSRNAALGITAGIWVLNAVEAYLGYGTKD
jgi:hypothetical protein